MAEKRNIFLVGPMGAGKSTIGRHLADELHLEFFDSDQEIERRSGADITWIFDLEGEAPFTGVLTGTSSVIRLRDLSFPHTIPSHLPAQFSVVSPQLCTI